jgi:fluoride ion exporter CrcB/FEX
MADRRLLPALANVVVHVVVGLAAVWAGRVSVYALWR